LGRSSVFITGGSRGIGKSIVRTFTDNGANIVAPARSELDLESNADIDRYFGERPAPEVDAAVFNAGINIISPLEDYDISDYVKVFQVDVFSSVRILKYLLPGMKARANGKIVFVSSLYASVSREGRGAYSSAKTALTGLVRTLTLECAPCGIMVNAVAPGYVMTDMTRANLSESEIDGIKSLIPTGRFQTEQEIADLTYFLCSEKNRSITGQLITIDGGFICR
jgi:3-oxoacyl-[acyl-carrier protein] reductase